MRIFFLFCLLGIMGITQLKAQTLELMHVRSGNHYYFQEGDSLCLKLSRQSKPLGGPWGYGDKETLWLGDSLISLESIEWVAIADKLKPPQKWHLLANSLIIGGAGFFALDQLNSFVLRGEPARINQGVVIASAALIGGGLLIKGLVRASKLAAKARIGRKYRIYLTED